MCKIISFNESHIFNYMSLWFHCFYGTTAFCWDIWDIKALMGHIKAV